MKSPEDSSLFSRWVNPANGAASYILTERVAPVQQTFYYTHPSFSADGRYLWFGCGFPPPGGRHSQQVLGVVDFEMDEARVYHETQFSSSRPVVDTANGDAYWGNDLDLWKRGPRGEDKAERVNRFPDTLAEGKLLRLATHPTFSADGRSLNIDATFRSSDGRLLCHMGEMPLDGSPFELWQTFEGRTYDHALFSPTDPDTQIFSWEYWQDHASEVFDGERPYHRIWILRRGEKARPLLREPVSHSGHEWWDADGKHVYYLHYGAGVKRVEIATGKESLVWPGHLSHGHCDANARFFVADMMENPGEPDCRVRFRDSETGNEVDLVDRPPLPRETTQCTHLHPHPQFCLDDRYVCYTTTALGRVDVALAPVEKLRARLETAR